MKYEIIEIGTSDFRIDSLDSNGQCMLIEPVKFYLDRIPNKLNITKVNAAISNVDGITDIFYTNLDYITKHKLPNWLRGCNSILTKHPTVVQYCKDHSINESDLIIKEQIKTIRLDTLFKMFDIEHIDYLKIDTEGHDCVILTSLFNIKNRPTINKIKFESNVLTNEEDYQKVIKLLENDYNITRYEFDTIAIKK